MKGNHGYKVIGEMVSKKRRHLSGFTTNYILIRDLRIGRLSTLLLSSPNITLNTVSYKKHLGVHKSILHKH